jgi:glycine C-acetyltransferase
LLIQRSRPQLFSNALPPAVAGGALSAIELLKQEPHRVGHLQENAGYLRSGLRKLGYEVLESPTAIIPIIVGDTARALRLSRAMLDQGVLITGFGYPVVPEGKARLRAQICATHTRNHLDRVLTAFEKLKAAPEKIIA